MKVTRRPPEEPTYDIRNLSGDELEALRVMLRIGYMDESIPSGPCPAQRVYAAIVDRKPEVLA
jgi:hypothetical protein